MRVTDSVLEQELIRIAPDRRTVPATERTVPATGAGEEVLYPGTPLLVTAHMPP